MELIQSVVFHQRTINWRPKVLCDSSNFLHPTNTISSPSQLPSQAKENRAKVAYHAPAALLLSSLKQKHIGKTANSAILFRLRRPPPSPLLVGAGSRDGSAKAGGPNFETKNQAEALLTKLDRKNGPKNNSASEQMKMPPSLPLSLFSYPMNSVPQLISLFPAKEYVGPTTCVCLKKCQGYVHAAHQVLQTNRNNSVLLKGRLLALNLERKTHHPPAY